MSRQPENVEEELLKLKSLVTASDEPAVKLVKSDKSLVVIHEEVASLKEHVVPEDKEKADSEKIIVGVCEVPEHRIVCQNVVLFGRNRVQKLNRCR